MSKLSQLYKKETGKDICETGIPITRMRGKWILDVSDEDAIDIFGYFGTITFPDIDYIQWLEDKLEKNLSL